MPVVIKTHVRIKEYWFYHNITTFKVLLKILKNPKKILQKLNSLKISLKLWKNPISKEKSLEVRALRLITQYVAHFRC